jgi:hypothetical protein
MGRPSIASKLFALRWLGASIALHAIAFAWMFRYQPATGAQKALKSPPIAIEIVELGPPQYATAQPNIVETVPTGIQPEQMQETRPTIPKAPPHQI